jgi:uncharacterized membrane protein
MALAAILLLAVPIQQFGWWKPVVIIGLLIASVLVEFIRYTLRGRR